MVPVQGIEPTHPAPFLNDQGPIFEFQVTVSKRLMFWDRSLMYHGVGKVFGIFLQNEDTIYLTCVSVQSSASM